MKQPRFKNFSDALFHWAKVSPEKNYLIDLATQTSYSYSRFDALVNRAATLLQINGCRPQQIISIRIRNSTDFLILYFAAIRIGCVVNPFPSSVSDAELTKSLAFIRPDLLITESTIKSPPAKTRTLTIAPGRRGKDLDSRLKTITKADLRRSVDATAVASLYLSSGTTGDPKGMLFSNGNIIARAKAICEQFGHTEGSVHLGFLPMGHTSITDYSFLPLMYCGGTLVIAENFLRIRRDFWNILKQYSVRYVQTVPTVLFTILNTDYPDFSRRGLCLPYVACGSAPLPFSTQLQFKKRFGIPVANLYGCSETGPAFIDDPRAGKWKPGSIGYPLKVHTCVLLDERGKPIRSGVGEIAIKSKTVCVGYYKNPAAYRRAMLRGYFRTGDLAYQDASGRYFFAERKKDLIIKGGTNIFPGEIDEVLFKHKDVAEASTIGVPSEFYGEDIVSFVVAKNTISEKKLLDHCTEHLQILKRPSRIIFLKEIPKTYSGKLLRRKLRELYEEKYRSV